MSARIAVLAGDGIGPEVVSAAIETLPDDLELIEIDAGARRYNDTGELLTEDDMARIGSSDAVLFGAVGDPDVPDGILERGILLRLRRELDLYVNLRPFPELDLTIVRENTEGLYAGAGTRERDSATEVSVNTRPAIRRCLRYAFELAARESRRLCLCHKTNVLVNAGGLWREVTEELGRTYPNVAVSYEHVDAAAYHLTTDPRRFDLIVTDNLFGDILSDVAAGVSGGLGRAASANIHPDPGSRPTRCVGLFEPVHGSAPDIAGRGVADPTAAIRAARLMMETLGLSVEVRT
jgi:3-isopropylmalate dehydrogenase